MEHALMNIRAATPADCLAIAELAQMAGDNIPGYFWADTQKPGQSVVEAGAELARSETANFSYRNVLLACRQHDIAAMMLAYRLPAAADNTDNPLDFPEFVRPMIELEQCVAESFYINMLATYPRFRGQGAGSALLAEVDRLALAAGCALISIEVFASNEGALRLYRRLGYEEVERRPMVASDYHPAGDVLLLTRAPTRD
jgi:ribosomal protein S18 acetylase RimI-like enzyme